VERRNDKNEEKPIGYIYTTNTKKVRQAKRAEA